MAEEMIESVPWESEEAEYPEAEEAIAEAEDSAEDYRRSRRPRKPFQAARGVQGITLRGRDGTRSVQFPSKLATVAETNRGLASQELARRALDERLDRLESRFRGQQKKDVATTGAVALAIGGGLSAIGAFQAANQPSGSALANWASQDVTKMAAVVSVTQLATSGAKLAFNGRYIRSGFGIAADAFSLLQIGLFTFGTLHRPTSVQLVSELNPTKMVSYAAGTQLYDPDAKQMYVVIQTNTGNFPVPVQAA
jgi:hypothetical protein